MIKFGGRGFFLGGLHFREGGYTKLLQVDVSHIWLHILKNEHFSITKLLLLSEAWVSASIYLNFPTGNELWKSTFLKMYWMRMLLNSQQNTQGIIQVHFPQQHWGSTLSSWIEKKSFAAFTSLCPFLVYFTPGCFFVIPSSSLTAKTKCDIYSDLIFPPDSRTLSEGEII